jgi:membrane protein DedA with SNARE-associated domain
MLSKAMFRPKRLLLYAILLIVGVCLLLAWNAWQGEMHAVDQDVKQALADYGPMLLFVLLLASGVGVALGEDVFIIPAGYLMAQGIMPFWETIFAAYFGVIMADTMWLLVCRLLSKRILNIRWFRRFMHPRRILELKYQFDQYGVWVVVISRFIPASRTTVITAAGIAKMNVGKFMLAETLSAIPTAICQLGIGYMAAKAIGTGPEAMHIREALGIAIVVLLVVGVIWWWRRSSKAKVARPRAKMAWLLEATGRRVPSKVEPIADA